LGLVDDAPDIRYLVEVLLADRYRLTCCAGAREAMIALPADPPDLLLLDLSLEGEVDGATLLAAVRAQPGLAGVPAIALTGMRNRQLCLEMGFDEHLATPIEPEALLALIARQLAEPVSCEPDAVQIEAALEELRVGFRERLSTTLLKLEQLASTLSDQSAQPIDARVVEIAHRLAGSGASYGYLELSQAARALELDTTIDRSERLECLLQVIRQLVDR
jgi:CheY-like chemotaxis protein